MPTTTIKFRGKKDIKAIYVVYRHSYKEHRFSTGVRADPKLWNGKKLTYPKELEKKESTDNKAIIDVINKIQLAVDQLIHEEQEPTVDAVYREYGANTERKTKAGIIELIDEYLASIKGKLAYNTHKNRKHDLEYFKEWGKGKKITASSFDIKLYNDFKSWLQEDKKSNKSKEKKGLSNNSASAIIKTLKIYLGWLLTDKKIRINPEYKLYDVSESYTENIYITQDELQKLWQHDFSSSPNLEIIRDRFVFQCRTGLRISDLNRFDKAVHIVNNKIQIEQQKNSSYIKLPLNSISAAILDKYPEFPYVIEQDYNRQIKECCEKAGIDRKIEVTTRKSGKTIHKKPPLYEIISSHDAVRTFITHGIENGITPQVMAAMTGKNIQVLLRNYYKTDDQTLERESIRAFGIPNLKIS